MKVAIVGSRSLTNIKLEGYLPSGITEIVSGGAKGIDACARQYVLANNIKLTEFLPEYNRYGKSAPLKRNLQIINYADFVMVFWDGSSHGAKYVIRQCQKLNKSVTIYRIDCNR
ncbi:MAG: DUF2493 domain-containing protein [Clostridiales bacterium]|nr:DUF2493 domain-containing protein [Clostridiales bacterium]